jgi:hypothetical protein
MEGLAICHLVSGVNFNYRHGEQPSQLPEGVDAGRAAHESPGLSPGSVTLIVKAIPHHDYLWKKVFAPWPMAG